MGISQTAALSVLRNGIWHESRFREQLNVNWPATIQDDLFWVNNWIEVEDEKLTFAKKYNCLVTLIVEIGIKGEQGAETLQNVSTKQQLRETISWKKEGLVLRHQIYGP